MTLHASAFLTFQTAVSDHPNSITLVLTKYPVLSSLRKADVSKVIEVRDLEEFTKEAVDAKLSAF